MDAIEVKGSQAGGAALSPSEFGLADIPQTLLVLPLHAELVFPEQTNLLRFRPARSRLLPKALFAEDGPELLLGVALKEPRAQKLKASNIFSMGVVLRVLNRARDPNGAFTLLVSGLSRARANSLDETEEGLQARITLTKERGDDGSVALAVLARDLRGHFERMLSLRPSEKMQASVALLEQEPGRLADLAAASLSLDLKTQQALLEELDIGARLTRARNELRRAFVLAQIDDDVRSKLRSDHDRNQHEYLLQHELDRIRHELGEAEDEESVSERLARSLEDAGMPEATLAIAKRELERMKQTPTAAAEHGVILAYLECLAALPWKAQSEDILTPAAARAVLDEDHWGLTKVKERIVEYIAVLSLKRDLRGPILCFVGPPGVGKTSLGRSIARALGRRFERIALGGVRDEAVVRGHRRTYVGAMPGRIIQHLRNAGTRNPVFMLDEIDKLTTGYAGDPASALLEVLDPEQNFAFSDHYLDVPFDLSQVLFIATANLADPIHPALRDRMEIIEVPGYSEEEKVEIAKRHLLPRQLHENGVEKVGLDLPEATLHRLISSYTREAGVRNLERELGAVCRRIARRYAEAEDTESANQKIGNVENTPATKNTNQNPAADDGTTTADTAATATTDATSDTPAPTNRIEPAALDALLGPVKFEPELPERAGRAGVAVGLAWTPAGGDILFVESTRMPGRGVLQLTGSLGDVMRESAEAARSWLRAHAAAFALAPQDFDASDFHVHVPQGAVPKDGPSAGVAMVVALASLLTGRAAAPDVAMTGEITLRGRVLPVGGVKEKVLAARRAGIRRVLLPEANRRDVDEIQPQLVAGLGFDYVTRVDEALRNILPAPRR